MGIATPRPTTHRSRSFQVEELVAEAANLQRLGAQCTAVCLIFTNIAWLCRGSKRSASINKILSYSTKLNTLTPRRVFCKGKSVRARLRHCSPELGEPGQKARGHRTTTHIDRDTYEFHLPPIPRLAQLTQKSYQSERSNFPKPLYASKPLLRPHCCIDMPQSAGAQLSRMPSYLV